MTLHIRYADYKAFTFTCPSCDWQGLGKDTCQNASGIVMDLECPVCFKILAIVECSSPSAYPSTLRRDTEEERQAKLWEINFRERFRRLSLKSPDELLDIQGDQIVFTFRSDTIRGEDYNIIEHQGQVVWREPMVWEGYERFMEIGRILKDKYGTNMVDLLPDKTAETFLYGDKLQAPAIIKEFRKQLRSNNLAL